MMNRYLDPPPYMFCIIHKGFIIPPILRANMRFYLGGGGVILNSALLKKFLGPPPKKKKKKKILPTFTWGGGS